MDYLNQFDMVHTDLLCYVICTVCYTSLRCMSGIIVQLSHSIAQPLSTQTENVKEISQSNCSSQVSHSSLSLLQLRSMPPELVMEFATAATVQMRTLLPIAMVRNATAFVQWVCQ